MAEQRAILRKSGFGDATVGPALRSLKADLEDLSRLVRPLLRVLGNLLADDDVVDHRYNNYIEDAHFPAWIFPLRVPLRVAANAAAATWIFREDESRRRRG